MSNINVTTKPYSNGQIVQETFEDWGGIRSQIVRLVIDTQEAQIRAALIALGWTPPPEKPLAPLDTVGYDTRCVSPDEGEKPSCEATR